MKYLLTILFFLPLPMMAQIKKPNISFIPGPYDTNGYFEFTDKRDTSKVIVTYSDTSGIRTGAIDFQVRSMLCLMVIGGDIWEPVFLGMDKKRLGKQLCIWKAVKR